MKAEQKMKKENCSHHVHLIAINWTQMCNLAKLDFKEEYNGKDQKRLPPIDEFGNTVLHLATQDDWPYGQVCYMLHSLKYKNTRNNFGLTPLHIIASKGKLKLCELILGCIEDKNPRDSV